MMERLQKLEQHNRQIEARFDADSRIEGGQNLALSWSNWGFGPEPLIDSVRRLARNGIEWIELHGNHYGPDLGYQPAETLQILTDHGIVCAGVCGMFSSENDFSSPSGVVRQRAIDYLKRTLDFAAELSAQYILVVPGAVGRPQPYDANEEQRSAATLRTLGDRFSDLGIRAAIEPIRSAETSFCHTIAEAKRYLRLVDHPAIAHINGDVYHMQSEEAHIGTAILDAGAQLCNLHLADSHRGALGTGSMDLDTMIRALYAIHYNRDGCFCTPEPLGPGGDPYPAMHTRTDPAVLDSLVEQSVRAFRERERVVLAQTAQAQVPA